MRTDTKKTVVTPGGRVGNDARHGSRSNGENWVERTRKGELPDYIRIVRNGLMKHGHSEGRATALAVAAMYRWARGGDNVSPKVQAAAAKAVAEWEAMKKEKAWDIDPEFKDFMDLVNEYEGKLEDDPVQKSTEGVGNMEHKAVGVSGLKVLGDPDDGIIEAYVSVTGLKDNVNDVIQPGAYAETLKQRMPKGIWSHKWDMPVSKTLEVKEVMPGDPSLPKTLPNGDPWPEGAGALYVKTQFNLNTSRGRDAYEDCKFFGDQQEWSIGYKVPRGMATMDTKSQTRNIKGLQLYEFSPVLWGAMGAARSMASKSLIEAQVAYKAEQGIAIDAAWLNELKEWGIEHDREFNFDLLLKDDDVIELEVKEESDLDSDTGDALEGLKGIIAAEDLDLLEKAFDIIGEVLVKAGVRTDAEVKAVRGDPGELVIDVEGKSLCDVLDAIDEAKALDEALADDFYDLAEKFDEALKAEDFDTVEQVSETIIKSIEDEIDDADPEAFEGLKAFGVSLGAILKKVAPDDPTDDPDEKAGKVPCDMAGCEDPTHDHSARDEKEDGHVGTEVKQVPFDMTGFDMGALRRLAQ
jgi:phage head maturation protease